MFRSISICLLCLNISQNIPFAMLDIQSYGIVTHVRKSKTSIFKHNLKKTTYHIHSEKTKVQEKKSIKFKLW